MKYENGRDLFPEDLLKQVQKYAAGRLVYIPSKDKRRGWGDSSGYKRYLLERNRDIKAKFGAGAGLEQLAGEYFLSCDTIKKNRIFEKGGVQNAVCLHIVPGVRRAQPAGRVGSHLSAL